MPTTHLGARIWTSSSAFVAFCGVAVLAGALVAAALTPAVALAGVGARQSIGLFEDLPSSVAIAPLDQKTRIFARSHGHDVLLASFFTQDRDVIAWSDVPQTVRHAAIAAEDVRFYRHGAIDPNGIARALVADALGRNLQGASTITQQYVKNVCVQQAEALPTAKRRDAAYATCTSTSVGRKLREMRLAIGLEKRYSKNEILLGYLNIAGFGGRVYGIESAAQYYFGKTADRLTAAEAAALIAIVNDPASFRLDQKANIAATTGRRDHILAVELQQHMLTPEQYRAAVATRITPHITPVRTGCDSAGVAGFFCQYVVNTLLTDPAFGATSAQRAANLETKGWMVHTTLNLDLQRTAQRIVDHAVPSSSSAFDVGAAAVSVEVGTGRVITMTQNKRYNALGSGLGRGYTAVNYNVSTVLGAGGGTQPGSTFKLFPLLEWLESGHSLAQRVNGSPRTVQAPQFHKCGAVDYEDKPWTVGNDEPGERGPYTVVDGTAKSVNGVFASMGEEEDLCGVRDLAESMGAKNARGGRLSTVPAMLIGGASSVAPLDMATAYATVAHGGITCRPVAIDRITDALGRPGPAPTRSCTRTVPKAVTVAAASALHSVLTSGTMRGDATLDGRWEFGKTGTTDSAKDTWAIGSTSKVTTAVWVGNVTGFQNLRDVYGFPYCSITGTTKASDERHCLWNGIQAAVNRVYGGAISWATPEARYVSGGAPITHADARPPAPPVVHRPVRVPAPPAPPRSGPTPPPAPSPTPKPTSPPKPKPVPTRTTPPKPAPKPTATAKATPKPKPKATTGQPVG